MDGDDDMTVAFERAECARRAVKADRDHARVLRAASLKLLAHLVRNALTRAPGAPFSISLDLRDGKITRWEVEG